MSNNPPSPVSEVGNSLMTIQELNELRAQIEDKSSDAPFLYSTAIKLLNHSIESSNTLSKQSHNTNNNIDKIELESLKRQAEALSWKLERSRWDARLTRWEAHEEVEPQGTSILQQDIETENRMLVGDKRVLKNKLEEALRRAGRLENELRQIRATLITKAHPGIEAWKDSAWHDGDASRSDQYGMGDARAEHLLLASKRLNTLIRKSHNPQDTPSLQPKQISRRKAMHSASSSTPKHLHHNGLENLINAATSVFDSHHGRSLSKSPTKSRPFSPSPQSSPKKRRVGGGVGSDSYVTGGDNRNEDPYLHYNPSPGSKPSPKQSQQQQQQQQQGDNQGSALDFLADHAVEQSNVEGTPSTSSYALPPKLNAMERDREHLNELGPPLRLRGTSPPTPMSPAAPVGVGAGAVTGAPSESPTKRFTPSGSASASVSTGTGAGVGVGASAPPSSAPAPRQSGTPMPASASVNSPHMVKLEPGTTPPVMGPSRPQSRSQVLQQPPQGPMRTMPHPMHPQSQSQSQNQSQAPPQPHPQASRSTPFTSQAPSVVGPGPGPAPHPMQQQGSHPSAAFSAPPPGFTSMRPMGPSANSRAPYTKWTSAEDALLAKAVTIHGQKWDAVSKMVGTRSYHQVRQRYLRKSGQTGTGSRGGQHNTRSGNHSYDRDDDDDEDSMDYSNSSTPQPTGPVHRPNTRGSSPSRKELFAK